MRRFVQGMFIACLFFPSIGIAQNEIDALRYSQSIYGPTARSMSMGGAFGALGGDFSVLSINPAGIGVYRSSEFSISVGSISRNTSSEFQGNSWDDSRFNITLGDLGLVLVRTNDERDANWKQLSFAIGHNRTNDLGTNTYYQGMNFNNSITDYFAERVNLDGGAAPSDLPSFYPFDANLAYQTYLIDPHPSIPENYVSIIPNGGILQARTLTSKGSQGEFSFALGANYRNRVNFGISFAFPNIKYEEEMIFEETDIDDTVINPDSTADFKSLRYTQLLKTTSNGFNAKIGMIFRLTDGIRLGAAYHTPTWYNMSDVYFTTMRSLVSNTEYYESSPDGAYAYKLHTPMKFVGSIAFIFSKKGLLSFDYEYSDLTSMKLKANDYSFSNENQTINNIYSKNGHVFRGGAEIRLDRISLRAGGAFYNSPFNKKVVPGDDYDQHVISFSGGIGYKVRHFGIDLAYSYSERSEYYTAYNLLNEQVPGAGISRTDHRVMLTTSVRF
jgi:hypothetical protein